VINELLKNELFLRWLPPLAGLAFTVMFIFLGLWQLDRAREKTAFIEAFENDSAYVEPADYGALEDFDRIRVFGRYLTGQQILIDNIPMENRLGYFVVTAFEPSTGEAALLVNRGWLPKPERGEKLPDISVDTESRTIRGLVGHLPRVAIRPGEAFAVHGDWPRVALYPSLEEAAAELGQSLLPVVLLLSPDEEEGYLRQWQPNVRGPMTNYGYAFQWFAMAIAVFVIGGWQFRKRCKRERTAD